MNRHETKDVAEGLVKCYFNFIFSNIPIYDLLPMEYFHFDFINFTLSL